MRRFSILLCTAIGLFLLAACETPSPEGDDTASAVDTFQITSRADSIAMQVYEEFGGPEAWASLPYLRFDFAGGTDSTRQLRASHLWDRMSGDYRLEMMGGVDTVYVALMNVNTREGEVYLNGEPVDSTQRTELLERAYRRYINDSYWLLAPVKMMDPGVSRTYVADSSTAETDVLRLSFADVGLTPGDQYWLYVDAQTDRVDQWAYRLQHHPQDHVPTPIEWTDYKTLQAPAGEILVAERKVGPGYVMYTDNVQAPAEVEDGAFTDPTPMLTGS